MLGTGRTSRGPGTPLLGHLMYSAPPKSGAAGMGAGALSLLFHAVVLTVAVLLVTGRKPEAAVAPSGFDIVLKPEAPPEPPPPPPVTAKVPEAPEATVRPPGFPELVAPTVTLTGIPPITPGPITDEAAFNGWGTPGGDPHAKPGAGGSSTAVDITNAPVFVPRTLNPSLKNVEEVRRALVRAYPPMLRDAGVTGRVLVWVLVDERGQVMKVQVQQTSGVPALDEAALSVARTMEFSPGMNGNMAVKVWVALPIDFRVAH